MPRRPRDNRVAIDQERGVLDKEPSACSGRSANLMTQDRVAQGLLVTTMMQAASATLIGALQVGEGALAELPTKALVNALPP